MAKVMTARETTPITATDVVTKSLKAFLYASLVNVLLRYLTSATPFISAKTKNPEKCSEVSTALNPMTGRTIASTVPLTMNMEYPV